MRRARISTQQIKDLFPGSGPLKAGEYYIVRCRRVPKQSTLTSRNYVEDIEYLARYAPDGTGAQLYAVYPTAYASYLKGEGGNNDCEVCSSSEFYAFFEFDIDNKLTIGK